TCYVIVLPYVCYACVIYIYSITVFPPTTYTPIFTDASVPWGKNKSTREPNLINPNSAPCVTTSFSFTYHTIRRARAPATCRKSTSTLALFFTTTVVRSLSVDDLGCQATKNFPG